MTGLDFSGALTRLRTVDPVRVSGRVTDVIGLVIEGNGPGLPIGGLCNIERRDGHGVDDVAMRMVEEGGGRLGGNIGDRCRGQEPA